MEIFDTLGLDQTMAMHFGIFVIVYLFLSNLLFKPYLRAFTKRTEQTVGKTDLAERFIEETKELEVEYSTKARQLNQKTKAIYDESRSEAMKQYDQIVTEARVKAKTVLDKTRGEIESQVQAARKQLKNDIPSISKSINQQVIGKEVAQ